MGVFDKKTFNSEVFTKYLETVPRVKQNAFLKAGVLRNRADLKTALSDQVGGNFITVPMTGLISGTADNYDGTSNITTDNLDTFTQSMIVIGRAHSWMEKDFSYDITGKDFMSEIASQTSNYWDDVNQGLILSTLKGIFASAMPASHTLDITSETVNTVGATTLNTAISRAAGANKNIFTLAIMHSAVATSLENLQVLTYWKETDADGVQKDMSLASWNGRTVLIDDDVPTEEIYTLTSDVALDASKTYYTRSGSSGNYTYTAVTSPNVSNIGSYYEFTGVNYTTYILGKDAFDYVDAGAKVPVETDRNALTNGGQDFLIQRERKVYAPKGFSFVQPNTPVVSPTNANLETGARWALVKNTSNVAYDSKAIPFARIISRG